MDGGGGRLVAQHYPRAVRGEREKEQRRVAGRRNDERFDVAAVLRDQSDQVPRQRPEAQRLGRVLRPKTNGETAHFYTLVTRDTREIEFAQHRQMFLTEQGYSYAIADENDVNQQVVKAD